MIHGYRLVMLAFRPGASHLRRPWEEARFATAPSKHPLHCRATSDGTKTDSDWTSLSSLPLDEALLQWQGDVTFPVELCKDQDLRSAAECIAEAFYVPSPFAFLNRLFFFQFQVSILDGMHSCLRRNRDGFVVLAVRDDQKRIRGAVQVSRQNEDKVLRHLPGEAASYAYVSSMAVRTSMRGRGLGKALLSAAEFVGWMWGEDETVLHVYSDNATAKALYMDNGFVEVPEATVPVGMFRNQQILMLRRQE